MLDYMSVQQKESRCPSIKHLYTKENSSVWMIISFLKNGFLFFLFNKKGLYWKVSILLGFEKKLHFPSWPGFGSEKSIRLGYTRFFFSFLHLSRFTITTNSFTKSTTYWAVCKYSELGQMALNFELITSGLSSLGQLMLKQFQGTLSTAQLFEAWIINSQNRNIFFPFWSCDNLSFVVNTFWMQNFYNEWHIG